MPLKERTMKHLLNAGWPEYKGTARVQYDLISFHSKKRKFLLRRDVEFWEEKLAQLKGDQDQVVYAPIVMVSQEALQKAEKQIPSQYNSQEIPTLVFQEGELLCLDGHSRIEAAKNSILLQGSTGFGIVHIVLDDIDGAKMNAILRGSCHQITPSAGRLYPAIRESENLAGREENRRLKSLLSVGDSRNLTTLSNCSRLSDAFDQVLLPFPAMAYAFPLGSFKTYHATLCEVSIEKYLVGYIFGFWSEVVMQTRNQVNDLETFQLSDIPSELFDKLQGLMPGVSEDDCGEIHRFFSHTTVLEGFSKACRIGLENSILKFNGMIPSMRLFGAHMVFLENISICMRELLELDKNRVKRGHGCSMPLETGLKGLYTAEMNLSDEYQIQTIDGWRTICAPFEDRQELSCRQLWLFVMREGSQVDSCRLAYTAKLLGFSSDLIEFRSADYMSCHEDRSVTLHPSDWTDFPNVKVKQRLGQKGNRWSEKSNSARKYLFFDIAETVGTEVAQQVQKQKDVTTLVELACIYRAFFGDPFFPSAYAKLPHASEATCLSSPTSTYPEGSYLSLSSLAPHGKGDGEIDSLSYDDWREPDHVLPSEPFEQLKEAYTQTARDTSKQPCGLIENNDHAYESSTSGYSSCVECEVGGRHLNESSTSGYSSCVECEVGGRHLNESSTSGYSSCVECEVGGRHPDGSSPLNRGVPMTPYVGGNTPIPRLDSSSIENLDHNWDGNNTLAPLSLLLTAKDACASSQSSRGLTDQNPKYIRPLNSATDSKGRVIADYKRTHGRINVNDDYGRTETIVTSSPTSLPLQPAKVRTRLDRQPAADKPIDETADKDRLKAQVVGGQTFCALDQAGEAGQRQQMYLQGRKEGRESEEEKPPSQCDLNKGIPTGSPVLSLQLGDDEHYQRSMSLFSAESYNDEDEGQIFDTNVVSSPVNPGELQREKEFEGEGRLLSTGTLPHNALRQAGTKADTTQTSTHDPGRAPPARERPLTAETSHITPVRSQTVPPRQEQAKGAQALDPVSSSNPVFCNISPRTRTRSRGNMENTLVSPGLVGAGNERSLQAPQQKNHFNNTKLNEQPHTKTTVKRLPQGQLAQDGSLRQTQVPQPGRQVDGMEATTHTKWQQPSVEDLDEAGSECIKTPVDGLVGNSPKSVSFDIYAEPAVPTTPQFAEKAQSNGASRGNRMSTCPSIRRSVTGLAALEKNGSPTIAADKWCLEEHIASRMAHSNGTKRRKSRSKHYGMNKRPCIELSVAGRLGKKPTKIMIRQRRARAEAEGNQLYGSRALATAEEMVRFSKESIVLQSEKTWTEPVSQLPLRTGPVQKSVETAATSQEPNKVHGKRWKPRRSKFETNKRPCIELPAVRHLGELSESVSRTGLGRGQIYGLQAEAATEEMTAFLERSKRSKLPQAENNSAEPLPRQCRNSSEFPTTGPLRESVETSAASQEPNKVYGNRWKSRRSKFETNKRPCIELPAVRHLGKLPESVSRTGLGRGQIYGLQAEAATEKMTSFLECSKRPKVPQSENKTTEPVSQQCRNRTVPPRTGPVREPVETPSVSESLGKGHEKRRNTGISEYTTNKRPCIEYPVPRPVDAISARASQRPVREQASSSGKGLVYGLQAVAATEKMTAFLKRSRVPQSKNNSTEPVSQQCRNRMEPSRTGPIQKPFPARGQYKDAGKRGKSREPDLKINKRPCIEYPVPRPVDATSAKTFQRPVRKQASSSGKGLVYGLQAVAATEKMTAFLKRSRVPQSEKDSIDSVSQQFRAHTELPRTRPSPEHAERTNSPQNSSKKYSAVVNDQLDLVTPPPHQAPNAESMASALPQQRPECSQLGQHRHDSSSTGRSTHVGSRQGANGSPGALSNPKALKNEGNALEPNTKTTRFSDTPHTGTSKGIRSHAMHSLPDGGPDNARLQPSPRRASPKASRGRARAMAQIKKTKKYPKKADYAHWINTFAFIVELKGEQVTSVHHRAKESVKPFLERHFRQQSKAGNFFDKSLRIVELDPSVNGATQMDRFFQTEDTLVFQHTQDEANPTKLVRAINRALQSKKKEMLSLVAAKHTYYLRSKKR